MTRHELRVLYLLHKHGGRAQHAVLTRAMHRIAKADRLRALATLEEDLELVSSAKTPPTRRGGRGGLVYWLTQAGRHTVEDLMARGELADPGTERR